MNETLDALENRRKQLLQQLGTLGDFRPGMISVNYRKCGKKNCTCAQPGHRGTDRSICGTVRLAARASRRICRWGRSLKRQGKRRRPTARSWN